MISLVIKDIKFENIYHPSKIVAVGALIYKVVLLYVDCEIKLERYIGNFRLSTLSY